MPHVFSRSKLMELYRWSLIVCGLTVFAGSIIQLFGRGIELRFVLLGLFTVFAASKMNIKLSQYNGVIDLSDTFLFLALLIWGAPEAILLTTLHTVALSLSIGRRITTHLFNAGLMAITMWTTAAALQIVFGVPPESLSTLPISTFVLAMCAMSLVQYAVSLTLMAIMQRFKMPFAQWQTWATEYWLWSCVTFFVAAGAAGFVVRVFGNLTLLSILTVAPVITLIYFTYRTYLRSVEALQESESRFRSSFDYATIGVALVSPEGCWLQVNSSLCDLLRREEAELLTLTYRDAVHPTDLPALEEKIQALLTGDFPAFQKEVRLVRENGESVWVLLSASTAHDAQKAVRHLILQTQDIDLRKAAEERLLFEATHDALTGLRNRASYKSKLDAALERTRVAPSKILAVLFLDLDGFKLVNDSLGHSVGDDLLKGTAKRLLQCVRSEDTVARLGGDEFTVLLEDLQDVSQAVQVAERIRKRLTEPFFLANQEIFIGTSLGIATTEIDYRDPGELLRDADVAMYQAKARGKGCYVVFDHEMHANANRQLRLANDLRRAVERNELAVHYQSIQTLENNELRGFEALVRWHHPTFGTLSPAEFVPLAEENGLINGIDNWMMMESCRQMHEWQKFVAPTQDLHISVNVSSRQFAQVGLIDEVKRALRETNLEPHRLQLEITETVMLKNLKNAARILAELSQLGVRIALDDFGTGYSSLSYLHELPITTLKVDRSFISRMTGAAEDGGEIVRTIVALARNLNMNVVAEGVETLEQLNQLREMNCNLGQGYLFSRPVVAAEAFKLIQSSVVKANVEANEARRKLRLVSNG